MKGLSWPIRIWALVSRVLGALFAMLRVSVSGDYASSVVRSPGGGPGVALAGSGSLTRSGRATTPLKPQLMNVSAIALPATVVARPLDAEQFETLLWGLGIVIALLAVHVIGSWRRG